MNGNAMRASISITIIHDFVADFNLSPHQLPPVARLLLL